MMKTLVLNPLNKSTKNIVRDVLYGCWCKGRRIGGATVPPHSLLFCASYLKHSGLAVDFIDAINEFKKPKDIEKIVDGYDFLVSSTSSMSFYEDAAYLKSLKESNNRLRTIVFGSHPTFMPKKTLMHPGIDIIIKGEPEKALSQIISYISAGNEKWKELKGVGFKDDNGSPRVTQGSEYTEDLDSLPCIDTSFIPKNMNYFNPIVKRMPYMTMVTSRGCPGRCLFCTAPFFYGSKLRLQSASRVLDEMSYLRKNGFKEIYFRDETFTADYRRLKDICYGIISKKLDITWLCNARSGTVDAHLARLMKRSGCHTVKLGVESGVQEILDKSNKGITVESTRDTVRYLKEAGINVHAHVMLGMPGETRETIEETIAFICKMDPFTASFGICTPYPGTPLFSMVQREAEKRGDSIDIENELNLQRLHTDALYNEMFTELDRHDLENSVRSAYKRFYLKPSSFIKYIKEFKNISRRIRAGFNVVLFTIKGDKE